MNNWSYQGCHISHPNRFRLVPKWDKSEPKCTETHFKKSQICPISGQFDPIWKLHLTSLVLSGNSVHSVKRTHSSLPAGLFYTYNIQHLCEYISYTPGFIPFPSVKSKKRQFFSNSFSVVLVGSFCSVELMNSCLVQLTDRTHLTLNNTVKHIHWCVVINKYKEESSRNN